MKISSVTVTFAATINTGNYTNLRPEITLTADLDTDDQGDVPSIVTNELLSQAKRWMVEYVHGLAQMQVNDLTAPYAEGDDPKQIERWLENQTPLYIWLKEYDPSIKLLPKLAERCPECKTLKVNGVCHNRQCEKSPDYQPPVVPSMDIKPFKVGDYVECVDSGTLGKVSSIVNAPDNKTPIEVLWIANQEFEWVSTGDIKLSDIPF